MPSPVATTKPVICSPCEVPIDQWLEHFISHAQKSIFLDTMTGLCSSGVQWPLVPNFCPRATRKTQIFHTNRMLGTLDFTVSEHWAPFNFP